MGVHCRDVINLVMLNLSKPDISVAFTKAKVAYGEGILKDPLKVIVMLDDVNGLLERCMKAMAVSALEFFFGRILAK